MILVSYFWCLPKPRFTVGKGSINFKGNLIITFTIHSEPVFRQGPNLYLHLEVFKKPKLGPTLEWSFLCVCCVRKKNILERMTKTLKHILKASCEAWYVKSHCITQFCCTCVFQNNNEEKTLETYIVFLFFFPTGKPRDYFPIAGPNRPGDRSLGRLDEQHLVTFTFMVAENIILPPQASLKPTKRCFGQWSETWFP